MHSNTNSVLKNNYLSEGRRKVIGYNGSGENTEASFQTGEIFRESEEGK